MGLLRAALPALAAGLFGLCNAQPDIPLDSAVRALHRSAAAEDAPPREQWAAIADDTVEVRAAHFDTAAVQATYRSDPALDYDRTLEGLSDTPFQRLLAWLGGLVRKLLAPVLGTKAAEWIAEHLHWMLLTCALGFLLYHFRGRLFQGAFSASAKARQVTEVEEDLARLDLDELLTSAEKQRDWRLALRYHYLKVLRRLVDDGLIEWQPRHTDQDYLHQLKEPGLRAAFSELSFLFKWVWYGDAPLDEARYRRYAPVFQQFRSTPPVPA